MVKEWQGEETVKDGKVMNDGCGDNAKGVEMDENGMVKDWEEDREGIRKR